MIRPVAFLVLGIGVSFIVISIAVFKIHPFLALILAGFLVGILSPVPLGLKEEVTKARIELQSELERGAISNDQYHVRSQDLPRQIQLQLAQIETEPGAQAVQALEFTTKEFGATAASIGVVIALAAIIGQCLLGSGAADKIVRKFLAILGERRAPTALIGSGYFLSIPVFFDTVFFLLIPLARALGLRTGKNFVLYVMAIAAGGIITHSLVPPTPGPLIMVDNFSPFGLDLGTALVLGFLIGLIPAAVGLLFAEILNRKFPIPLREAVGSSREQLESIVRRPEKELPHFLFAVLPVVLPVLLIAGNTALAAMNNAGIVNLAPCVLGWSAFFGNKNFALLAGAAVAVWMFRRQSQLSLAQLRDKLEPAIMSAGLIILITSAGGAFGKMLSRCGIGEALRELTGGEQFTGAGLILLAFGLSSLMKIAQGSGTVAMITASAMIASLLSTESTLPCHPIYLFAAIGFGSNIISWMNDSAFWVVCKMSGFTERETLSTWTPLLAVICIAGLVEVEILHFLFG
jgi:GntP family gluconate:H+ symporter